MSKKRIGWIDVARGIGMILVVYGHALSADSIRYIIYAFHMPLFFFLSGIVFSYKPDQTIRTFLTKNGKGILYPYAVFALLSFILWIFRSHPSLPEQGKQFLSIFYGNGNNGLLAFNNLLWFLPCLFAVRVGFYFLLRLLKETRPILIGLFIFSLVGYLTSVFMPQLKLFFGIETALTAMVFFGVGYIAMQHEKAVTQLQRHKWMIVLVSGIVCVSFAVLNFQSAGLQVDMRMNRLNNYAYFYLAGFAGTVGVLSLSTIIKKNFLLESIGKHSLVIFAWHMIAFSYISFFLSVTGGKKLLALLPGYVSQVFYTFAAIGLTLLISLGWEKIASVLSFKADTARSASHT